MGGSYARRQEPRGNKCLQVVGSRDLTVGLVSMPAGDDRVGEQQNLGVIYVEGLLSETRLYNARTQLRSRRLCGSPVLHRTLRRSILGLSIGGAVSAHLIRFRVLTRAFTDNSIPRQNVFAPLLCLAP